MKATAVIGMNFGDEGKGHIVNFLSNDKTLNVRFNGGAQAAHAVFLDDGRSHIFHSLGSGTLKGARTLFASHFILNPIFLMAEIKSLYNKTSLREIFVDPRCRVTTPYDMLINEFSCHNRGKNDTTGFGINETVKRSKFRQLRICMRDLIDRSKDSLMKTLAIIRDEYVPWRLEKLSLPYNEFLSRGDYDGVLDRFMEMIESMLKIVVVVSDSTLIDRFIAKEKGRQVVFEGAQGYRLDQNRTKLMPYLTRSSTGLNNVKDCLIGMRTEIDLDVCLVTRTYLTRHGDGPLWNEVKKPYNKVEEITNVPNPFQGPMRYGYLNKSWYDTSIMEMRMEMKDIPNSKLFTAFTCLDHLDEDGLIYSQNGNKEFLTGNVDDFSSVKIISDGMTEGKVKWFNKP